MQTATFKNDLDNAAQEPGLSRSRCLHHLASTNLLLAFAGGPANAGSTGIRRTGARLPRCRQHVRAVPAAATSHGQWHPPRARIAVPVASYACGTPGRIEGLDSGTPLCAGSQAGLAVMKGGWLAAVVGSNVFLPAFIAGFGKCHASTGLVLLLHVRSSRLAQVPRAFPAAA